MERKSGNKIFSQYCVRNEKRYVKCDICSATRYIDNDIYTEINQHMQHQKHMPAEIQHLQLLERCHKRAVEEPAESLRQNFWYRVTVCWKCSCFDCHWWNRKLHKRQRRLLPLLPTDANDVAAQSTATRYEMCDGQQIFRRSVNLSGRGTACIFASDSQLHLLSATSALTALMQKCNICYYPLL